MTVGNNWTNVTFEELVPGRQYTLEMASIAGPYRSPVQSATDWTCECVTPTSTLLQIASVVWPTRAERSRHGSEAECRPCMGSMGNQGQGCKDRQRVESQPEPHSARPEVKESSAQEKPITEQKTFLNVTQQERWGPDPMFVVEQKLRQLWRLICQG